MGIPPTVTFILGLCGSGKTWHGAKLLREGKVDEFIDENLLSPHHADQRKRLVRELRNGKNCAVSEILLLVPHHRDEFLQWLRSQAGDFKVEWLCIENNLEVANRNCEKRTNKGRAADHIAINEDFSPLYECPDGVDPEPIHEL